MTANGKPTSPTLARVIQIGVLIVGLVVHFTRVEAALEQTSARETEHYERVVQEQREQRERLMALDDRVTALEVQAAAIAERLRSIDEHVGMIYETIR